MNLITKAIMRKPAEPANSGRNEPSQKPAASGPAASEHAARQTAAALPSPRTPRPLDWVEPPRSFPEAVAYVAAYLERHPTTWYAQFADGRVCHLSESLQLLCRWLRASPPAGAPPVPVVAPVVRGEGWSL